MQIKIDVDFEGQNPCMLWIRLHNLFYYAYNSGAGVYAYLTRHGVHIRLIGEADSSRVRFLGGDWVRERFDAQRRGRMVGNILWNVKDGFAELYTSPELVLNYVASMCYDKSMVESMGGRYALNR